MSGHNKWSTIKHKKGAADARRGRIFSKISKELMVAARAGGSDIDKNPALGTVVQKARSVNMPADNIERAIKKGAGEIEGSAYEEAVYEGYASGGVALIVKVLTDNKNRAASEIRHIFSKHGSGFASQGSVSRGFERKGQILVDASTIDEDKLLEIVLEAGAQDMGQEEGQYEILTEPQDFAGVVDALVKAGIATLEAEISQVPMTIVPVMDKTAASSIFRFISELEENEDVQNVYTNMDVPDDLLAELTK